MPSHSYSRTSQRFLPLSPAQASSLNLKLLHPKTRDPILISKLYSTTPPHHHVRSSHRLLACETATSESQTSYHPQLLGRGVTTYDALRCGLDGSCCTRNEAQSDGLYSLLTHLVVIGGKWDPKPGDPKGKLLPFEGAFFWTFSLSSHAKATLRCSPKYLDHLLLLSHCLNSFSLYRN
jgi:hypothetical protein